MKKTLLMLLIFTMFMFLCACGNSNDTESAGVSNENSIIELKGTFLLEPAEELDLSEEGLDPAQRYLLLVYDVANNSDRNEELSHRNDSITLTMNNTNSYKQLSSGSGRALKSFQENCGYAVSTDYGTLWGGSGSVRMIAAFAINGNDIKEDCMAMVQFELSDNLHKSVELMATDIQTIHWFDDVFSVEDNSDAYQVAHSIKNRVQICKTALETASQAERNGDTYTRDVNLALCGTIFSEDTLWGVSCAGYDVSSDLPVFRADSIQTYFPELTAKIETVASSIKTMMEELEKDTPDYDSVNTAQRLAYNTLNEIIEYFDAGTR